MKVAVTSKAFSKNETLINYLAQFFPEYKLNLTGKKLNDDELVDFLSDVDAVIVALESINDYVLSKLPNLKYVSKFGVGLNNIDFDACERHNVKVLYKAGVNKGSVAEMSLGFSLMLLRNLYTTSNLLSHGEWRKSGGVSLYGKTVGIIGAGHIGEEFIRLLQPFGCNILINDILDKSKLIAGYNNVKQVPLDSLLNQSDVVSLHVPLTVETEQLVDTSFLAKMKPSAVLLNTARGELVDQLALKSSLLNAQIAGAAIDVYDQEPPTDLELLSIPNLIPTPHIGGNSLEATLAMGKAAIHNLSDL